MKNNYILIGLLVLFLSGCFKSKYDPDQIVSIQTIDRNGFSETISNRDRLSTFQKVDFISSQPFQKVLRVFGKDGEGKSQSKLTSYHSNGGIWQYLEAVNGRAHGRYLEWYENATLKIEATVIEGVADLNEIAQTSWLFEGMSRIWDEDGHLIAEIPYEKGLLHGLASYFHANGKLKKQMLFENNLIEKDLVVYDEQGTLMQKIPYLKGMKHGQAVGFWRENLLQFEETFRDGYLMEALYFRPNQEKVAEIKSGEGLSAQFSGEKLYALIEFHGGQPEGEVQIFDDREILYSSYEMKDGKKHGPEWEYYPKKQQTSLQPKMMVSWCEDRIEGMVKTWYENGILESEREMSGNKKQGLSIGYYLTGDLMLIEEYDHDRLIKGSYYKKGEKTPTSTIEQGNGIATLFHPQGHFLRKIPYEKGHPIIHD